jgi:ubiquinone biosynthesis protein
MSTLSNLRTYERVISVLVRYGFADVLARSGVDSLLAKATRRNMKPHEPTLAELPRAVRVRKALEELGPTFMKLGQVLSTRGDLVPKEYAEEFAHLQSDCPTVPWEKIRAKLDHEYRGRTDEYFSEIDPVPIACGTMAQAHFAWLKDGTPVVLKVLRPGIHEQIDGDLHTLGVIAQYAEDHFASLGFSPTGVVREFSRQLRRELDLTIEGRSTARLETMFADQPGINFARVYWAQTTKNILCLERVQARVLARVDVSQLSSDVRRSLVENGVRAVLKMCLAEGFFHADPHPGNIMVHDDGRVTFIDCGMCASVTEETRSLIADLIIGVVDRNPRAVLSAALAIGHVDIARVDRRSLEIETNELCDAFVGVPLEQVDLSAVLQQFFDVLRRSNIQCPPDLVLLIKAISTIQGVGASLDPNFEMVAYARPYLEGLVRSRYTTDALKDRMITSLATYARTIERLPGDIADIITRIRENRIGVNLDLEGIDEFNENVHHASTNIGYSVLLAALLLSSSVLVLASTRGSYDALYYLGTAGSFVSFFLTMLLLIRNFRLDRQSRRRHRDRRMKR